MTPPSIEGNHTTENANMDRALDTLSLEEKLPEPDKKVTLVLNVATDYVAGQGVGLGITLRVKCSKTGNHIPGILGKQEWRQGITHERFAAENIATSARAHMLAFCRAMGIARQTFRQESVKSARINKVKIVSAEANVVDMMRNGPASLREVKDRRMIRSVLAGITKLEKLGLEVEIAHDESGEMVKATKTAKQKGRKACRSRRKFYAAQKNRAQVVLPEQEAGTGTEVSNFEPLWRVLLRKKERRLHDRGTAET
ncbi:hypothetical protein HII31_00244 [Pseudocercospora fuligena]|uniref:Uncharacterized protein n=1 Tax=Pseudocercospora fuligena TaxID=685502 RepID=A0A8H6VNN0_9PEZI|nr:hypothetical protein HII31_00244 [Pseudocercospora fuligena]